MKKLLIMFLTLALALSMTACGSSPDDQSIQDDGDVSADYSKQLVIGSSNAGGTYYTIGAGWTSLMNDKLGTNISCEVTAGPATNIPQVESGDLGLQAWSHPGWRAKPLTALARSVVVP